MGLFSTGTISTTAGSPTITGSGTTWTGTAAVEAGVQTGALLLADGDSISYEIVSVDADGQITLATNYPTTRAGINYQIFYGFTTRLNLPQPSFRMPRADVLIRRAFQLIDNAANFGLSYQGYVLDKDLTAEAGGEADGDLYIVGAGATGDWSGHDGEIAESDGAGGWTFTTPLDHYLVWVADEGKFYVYFGSAWNEWNAQITIVDPSGAVLTSLAVDNMTLDGSRLSATGDLEFQCDSDNNGSNSFLWKNGAGSNIMTLSEAGALAISAGSLAVDALTIDSNTIYANTGTNAFFGWNADHNIGLDDTGFYIKTGGSYRVVGADAAFYPFTTLGQTLGTSSKRWGDAWLGNLVIGSGAAGVDYRLTFDGETNDGTLDWMEDEDYFRFNDDLFMATGEKIFFGGAGVYIYDTGSNMEIGSPATITLVSSDIRIGNGSAGVDYTLTFNGETNDGVLKWWEDENYLSINDYIVNGSKTQTLTPSGNFTIDPASGNFVRVNPSAPSTCTAISDGLFSGQELTIVNIGALGVTINHAANQTINQGAANIGLAGLNDLAVYVWDSTSSLWRHKYSSDL